ncbi:MAG TPA: hypothetical protein VGR53_03725 [Nitrososphaerales archaeon]|nr:hypothetical protein [Nitrososphaerales archaeon]
MRVNSTGRERAASLSLLVAFFLALYSAAPLLAVGAGPQRLVYAGFQNQCFGAATFDFVGYPSLISFGRWEFINVTVFDSCAGNGDVIMFTVWKTINTGETVAVQTGGARLTTNQTMNFYVPVFNISPSTYDIYFFGVSTTNNPLSYALEVLVTVG